MRQRPRQDASIGVELLKEETRENVGSNELASCFERESLHVTINNDHGDSEKDRHIALVTGVLFILILALIHGMTLSSLDSQVQYSCPAATTTIANKAANDIASENVEYERATNQIKSNLTGYMQSFRNSKFDAWGRTYERVKEGMYHWKSTRFAPHLKNGDSIYESACGIGMNLYMTMEILNEFKGIESVTVYGNEYVPASADLANQIWDRYPPFQAQRGTICPGDSASIDFVPSSSFDLVYTGYITPINDPLRLHKGDMEQNNAFYRSLCEGKDRQSVKLAQMAQRVQEDFYGKWVGEMVRIAKPGEPVIVEQVSMPLCVEPLFDWGGVAKDFWPRAISRYGWDVDPTSIEMEKDSIFRNRYHVFMRKNSS